jgi:hypothetical protein
MEWASMTNTLIVPSFTKIVQMCMFEWRADMPLVPKNIIPSSGTSTTIRELVTILYFCLNRSIQTQIFISTLREASSASTQWTVTSESPLLRAVWRTVAGGLRPPLLQYPHSRFAQLLPPQRNDLPPHRHDLPPRSRERRRLQGVFLRTWQRLAQTLCRLTTQSPGSSCRLRCSGLCLAIPFAPTRL